MLDAMENSISLDAAAGPSIAVSSATIAPAAQAARPPYPAPAETPTQDAADGINFDFNEGARVRLPARTGGQWRVRLRDLNTGNILFESHNKGAFVRSSKRFYVRFGIDVWAVNANGSEDTDPRT